MLPLTLRVRATRLPPTRRRLADHGIIAAGTVILIGLAVTAVSYPAREAVVPVGSGGGAATREAYRDYAVAALVVCLLAVHGFLSLARRRPRRWST